MAAQTTFMVILKTMVMIAAVAGWIYLHWRTRLWHEERTKRKIHVQTLFRGENDRHLNE
jgi:hypothetical protein